MGNVIALGKRKINRYAKIKGDPELVGGLEELRHDVENQGNGKIKLKNGIYRANDLEEVRITKWGAWEFGYQVKPTADPAIFMRRIFIKLRGDKILAVAEKEREIIMASVFESMIDKSSDLPSFNLIADDCILVEQEFMVAFMHEFNPNIVTPGKKG